MSPWMSIERAGAPAFVGHNQPDAACSGVGAFLAFHGGVLQDVQSSPSTGWTLTLDSLLNGHCDSGLAKHHGMLSKQDAFSRGARFDVHFIMPPRLM